MSPKKSTSPWIYVGCGCLALVVLMVAVVACGGYLGFTKLKGYVEDLEDPERRNARALELLGAEALPEGYYTLFFLPVPWVFDFVMLTDSEGANQTLEAMEDDVDTALLTGHIFFYLRSSIATDPNDENHFGVVQRQMKDGRIRIEVSDQRFVSDEELGSGQLQLGTQDIQWNSHRGAFVDDAGGAPAEGLFSVMNIACPEDSTVRSAVWFRRAAEGEALESMEVEGSPADVVTLEQFMRHFDFCRV